MEGDEEARQLLQHVAAHAILLEQHAQHALGGEAAHVDHVVDHDARAAEA
jgi:hypothetical protein